jgi:hypothetical protein
MAKLFGKPTIMAISHVFLSWANVQPNGRNQNLGQIYVPIFCGASLGRVVMALEF